MFYGDSSSGQVGNFPFSYHRATDAWNKLAQQYANISSDAGMGIGLANGNAMFCWGKDSSFIENTCTIYNAAKNGTLVVAPPSTVYADAYTGPSWVELSDGRSVIIGGGGTANRKGAIYNPTTDTWTYTANAPNYIGENKSVVLAGDKILVFNLIGGTAYNYNPSRVTGTYIYDVGANSWTDLTAGHPFPWGSTSLVGTSLVTTSTGRIFIIGGFDDSTGMTQTSTYEFNPTTYAWTTHPSMSTARAEAAAAATTVSGTEYIYVAAGGTGTYTQGFPYTANPTSYTATMERFDLTTNTWSTVGASGGFADWGTSMIFSPGDQAFFQNGYYETGIYRIPIATNVASVVTNAPQTMYSSHINARLADGRLAMFGTGNDDMSLGLVSTTTTVTYSGSGGDGDYTFALNSGAGTFFPACRMYVPNDTLPSTTATISLTDASANSTSATATTP